MFEYVKNRELEERRKMTIYSVLLLLAVIATIAAIVFAYN